MTTQQARALLQRYNSDQCTPAEKELIDRWYDALEQTGEAPQDKAAIAFAGEKMKTWLDKQLLAERETAPVRSIRTARKYYVWAAAASVALIALVAGYLWQQSPDAPPAIAKVISADSITAPASVKATITLSNGLTVPLDSLSQHIIAEQSGVQVEMLASGEIVYHVAAGEDDGAFLFNTLDNPRGSRVATIVLADGSKVWLNAASSLTYPIAFHGNERKVSITGEAYFEVAHNAAMPFKVAHNGTEVKVLGTHFNINTYPEASATTVTLLEGSVEVSNGPSRNTLKPGQQASVTEKIQVKDNVDTEQVMAWKNGYFHFDNASLRTVMQEVGRWYDMDITFKGALPDRKFGGEISRNSSLGQVLKILEEIDVNFQVDNKQIIVNP